MHLFSPHHVQLLNSCYPPSSVLLTAGPDYSPNSQELSRLTYFASNHPGKIAKIGSELEKRLKNECRKAQAGNFRARALLLITLAIFRALATECRRDIAPLSNSLISSVDIAISTMPLDLEVVARAASVFTAWATYTDGHLIGADSNLTRNYLSVLQQFSTFSCCEAPDFEVRNRTRLIGFGALTGALNSEALYNDSSQFRVQVARMMLPILVNLFQTDLQTLEEQAANVREPTVSVYLAEFRTRPTAERRAASIHVHIDGDKGPSMADVSEAALHSFYSLLVHATGAQLGFIMLSSFDSLDILPNWQQLDHCCWLAQKMAEWAQYQYRYVVPTWIVERMVEQRELPTSSPMHQTLAAMVTTVLNSPTPLVNLSTSDIISSLTTVLLRRTEEDPDDAVVSALVECIAALGRHVYYSDQIQDLAGELISRLITVEAQSVVDRNSFDFSRSRSRSLRCILGGLIGLIKTARKYDVSTENQKLSMDVNGSRSRPSVDEKVGADGKRLRTSRRTRVPPDFWQDTLSLLCDKDYAVRADYSEALIFYISQEMPKDGESTDVGGPRHRPLTKDTLQHHHSPGITSLLHTNDYGTKLLNAANAYLYILSTSSSLGSPSLSPSDSQGGTMRLNVLPPTPISGDVDLSFDRPDSPPSSAQSQSNGKRSFSYPAGLRTRKTSAVQRLLERLPHRVSSAACASLADYKHILDVLTTIHEQLPFRGLLTTVPMLVALEASTNSQDLEDLAIQRINTIREVITSTWLVIGKVWKISELVDAAESALATATILKRVEIDASTWEGTDAGYYHSPREPIDFSVLDSRAENVLWAGLSAETAVSMITRSQIVQETTSLDRQTLLRRLSVKWTPESAFRDCLEPIAPYDATLRGDGLSPLLKISPALMHNENMSLQSLARSTRGVGVMDYREALEGRSNMSNPALVRPPSVSTLDHASSIAGGERLTQTRSRSRSKKRAIPSGEVRDVLNKLGIGKQNGSLLKASFPSVQKLAQ